MKIREPNNNIYAMSKLYADMTACFRILFIYSILNQEIIKMFTSCESNSG